MNPKNLETFPELILPLDPIVLEGSIASEDFLMSGNFFASENNSISEYSLPTQEIDVDPLTSMAKDPPTVDPGAAGIFFASENNFISEYSLPTQEIDVDPLISMAKDPPKVDPGDNDYNYSVTTLKNSGLKIDWDGTEYKVSVALRVELSSSERNLINNGGRLVLQSKGVGIDNPSFDPGSFDWSNDDLFYFPDQQITSSGIYRFSTVVDRSVLNEDRWPWESIGDNGRDEIAAKITLAGYSGTSLVYMAGISTNVFMGWF
jgi:hypothetical protein